MEHTTTTSADDEIRHGSEVQVDDAKLRKETKNIDQPSPTDDTKQTPHKSNKRKRKRKRKNKNKTVSPADANNNNAADSIQDNNDKSNELDLTVYVEGIPFDASEEQVRDFFVENGCPDVQQLRLPRWQDTGRLRGFGHVVFESEASVNKALNELNKKHLGSRYLSIQPPKQPKQQASSQPRPQPTNCKTVFVKNLPYDATEDDVFEVFRVCGKIDQQGGGVRIARNYQTRESKGFAYVEFKNPEGALHAVQKASTNNLFVFGRPCFVDYEERGMKGSFKTKEGRLWTREYGGANKKSRTSY